ncbi:hypothetical protein MFM001_28840 [Mycobacterium sp. MFM001]|nr:hypothetical protein MFM001_28840 [Mycobacterium sp. MFM001]
MVDAMRVTPPRVTMRFMRRWMLVLSTTAVVGLAVSSPAVADSTDDAFLASLQQANISFRNPDQAITAAHTVCQMIANGKQGPEVLSVLQSANPGITSDGARMFLGISLNAYCPERLPPSGGGNDN